MEQTYCQRVGLAFNSNAGQPVDQLQPDTLNPGMLHPDNYISAYHCAISFYFILYYITMLYYVLLYVHSTTPKLGMLKP